MRPGYIPGCIRCLEKAVKVSVPLFITIESVSKVVVKIVGNGMITCYGFLSYASKKFPMLLLLLFVLYFLPILLCLSNNDSWHQHNYPSSMIYNFESEHQFGDYLEDPKFDELSEHLQ